MVERIESAGIAMVRAGVEAANRASAQVNASPSIQPFHPDTDLLGGDMAEMPPAFVFAPGFLHSDRRGLVPYPGLDLAEGMVGMVLARRYVQGGVGLIQVGSEMYDEISRLGLSGDEESQSS